jgi:hypothetical protein
MSECKSERKRRLIDKRDRLIEKLEFVSDTRLGYSDAMISVYNCLSKTTRSNGVRAEGSGAGDDAPTWGPNHAGEAVNYTIEMVT